MARNRTCVEVENSLLTWDNVNGPGGASNTLRGLTHSLDLGEEGLAMKATREAYPQRTCLHCGDSVPQQFIGQPRKYCSDHCRSEYRNEARRNSRNPRPTLADRLARKLHRTEQGCQEFTGHRNEHGYGVMRGAESKASLAHRVAWTLKYGPIPSGMCVCHHCDNPPCCNPDHLFLATHEENMRDRDRKGRTLRGDALRKVRWNR